MSTKKPNTKSNQKPGLREEAKHAFDRIRTRLDEIEPEEVLKPRLRVSRAVGMVLAAEPRIQALLPEIRKALPEFASEQVRDLRDIALAAYYAHLGPVPKEHDRKVSELVAAGTELRNKLLIEANGFAAWRLLNPEQVAELRGGRGHENLANGLVGLARLFRDNWDAVAPKTAATREDLARAEELGIELIEALGARDLAQKKETTHGEALRAVTLLVQTYEEVRAAVVYLRRKEKDADEIAPSLYVGRGRKRSVAEEEVEPEVVEPEVIEPAPAAPLASPVVPPSTAPAAPPRSLTP